MLPRVTWGSETDITFELYRSPTGGSPFWTESRTVSVEKNNAEVTVDLGEKERLPNEAFTTSFRFLSILHNGFELGPRKQVASVVYVASEYELDYTQENYLEKSLIPAIKAAKEAPGRESSLDKLVDCGTVNMETHPRMPGTWLEAEAEAAKLDARLPTFQEWYGAYDGEPAKKLSTMEGHYEWVIPWVYEPQIHQRLHELYRGKPVACYYNELSPMNKYPYRLAKSRNDEDQE